MRTGLPNLVLPLPLPQGLLLGEDDGGDLCLLGNGQVHGLVARPQKVLDALAAACACSPPDLLRRTSYSWQHTVELTITMIHSGE